MRCKQFAFAEPSIMTGLEPEGENSMLCQFGGFIRLAVTGIALIATTESLSFAAINVRVPLTTEGAGQVGNCDGSGFPAGDPRGFVNAHLQENQGVVLFNVHLRNADPNATYEVSIRCGAVIGTVTTNRNGVGNATIVIDSAGLSSPFALNAINPATPLDIITTSPIIF
jgi:hypothetical protein